MRQVPTPSQRNSLALLYNGNHADRERVLAAQPPEVREELRAFINVNRETGTFVELLLYDLAQAWKLVEKDQNNQFLRRIYIRSFIAAVEGIIYRLKQSALATGKLAKYNFNEDEHFFLSEIKTKKTKRKFPAFDENVKETFRVFARVYGMPCPTDFGDVGFHNLCKTCKLRDRLMHPKSTATFIVRSEETKDCADAARWLHFEFTRLFEACQSSNLANSNS